MGCLTRAVAECERKLPEISTRSQCTDETARQIWDDLRNSDSVEDLESFANACPGKPQALLAANRARRFQVAGKKTPVPEPTAEPETASGVELIDPAKEAQKTQNRDAQRELRRIGYYQGAIDGIWGPQSSSSLTRFMRQAGLSGDPEVNADMIAKLRSAAAQPARGQYDGRYTMLMECGASGGAAGFNRSFELTIANGEGALARGKPRSAGYYDIKVSIDASGKLWIRGRYNSFQGYDLNLEFYGEPSSPGAELKATGKRGPRRCEVRLAR